MIMVTFVFLRFFSIAALNREYLNSRSATNRALFVTVPFTVPFTVPLTVPLTVPHCGKYGLWYTAYLRRLGGHPLLTTLLT